MSTNNFDQWKRIEYDSVPIYVNPDMPDWFVPNNSGDKLLKADNEDNNSVFINRIRRNGTSTYSGRDKELRLQSLKECWIHLTNSCNLRCNHCMFTSSPNSKDELSLEDALSVVDQSLNLGSEIFYFTGGEPLVSKKLFPSLEKIFNSDSTHVVILSNLLLLSKHLQKLESFPKDRLHFQVSIDGLEKTHDDQRGKGTFDKLVKNISLLKDASFPCTLAMTVTQRNVNEMTRLVEFAHKLDIQNIHFMWLFKKGMADDSLFVETNTIVPQLKEAYIEAEKYNIAIDNIEIIKSQVFSCPGTKHDLSNAGWQSMAVGPDGYIYPTPALIYNKEMICGHIQDGLRNVWKYSPLLDKIRKASLINDKNSNDELFKFIIGGGDIDHSIVHSGKIVGGDPYMQLYSDMAKWLIVKEANSYATVNHPSLKLKMGEIVTECPAEGEQVFYTHSNCVLTLPGKNNHAQVNSYYSEAVKSLNDDIKNPICYPEETISHIPEKYRFRNYGCGSPVLEAAINEGETIVDLGCGTGVECFIASKLVGEKGSVIGVDMGDDMLQIANDAQRAIENSLLYSNVQFKKAYLELLPLEDNSVDVIISNCVINLTSNKRKVFNEIYRILKPGGRLLISDITYADEIPLSIKYNEKLRGECLGGALHYEDLIGLINDLGFVKPDIKGVYLYKMIKDYPFYSLTYSAVKPIHGEKIDLFEIESFDNILKQKSVAPSCGCGTDSENTIKVETGDNNDKSESSNCGCDCSCEPEVKTENQDIKKPIRQKSGCMVCGDELIYLDSDVSKNCYYCEKEFNTNTICKNEHFVCDTCHSEDAKGIIKQVCLNTDEKDMIGLMKRIRSSSLFPVHGPEHHAMVPAVILTAMKNSGYEVSSNMILKSIDRGFLIPGGSCGFIGSCGAATGVGAAFAILTESTPYKGKERRQVMQITSRVLHTLSEYDAARCCQRDSWRSLQEAKKIAKELFQMDLKADEELPCDQFDKNNECIYEECPLWNK